MPKLFPISNDQNIIQIIGIKAVVITYPVGGYTVEEIAIEKTIRKRGKYFK